MYFVTDTERLKVIAFCEGGVLDIVSPSIKQNRSVILIYRRNPKLERNGLTLPDDEEIEIPIIEWPLDDEKIQCLKKYGRALCEAVARPHDNDHQTAIITFGFYVSNYEHSRENWADLK